MITWMTDGAFIWGCRDGYGFQSDQLYSMLVDGAVIFWHEGLPLKSNWQPISADEARADFEDWALVFEVEIPTEYQLKQWGL